MVAGLLGNESSDSNRFTLVTPKSENDVRLQATLGNQNPTVLPVGVVREPIKGGTLATPPDSVRDILYNANPDMSIASWAVRYVASLDGIITVLSGMSTMEQVLDNISYMKEFKPLSEAEQNTIKEAQKVLDAIESIPCTACRYCTPGCPMGIEIPDIFKAMNWYKIYGMKDKAKNRYEGIIEKSAKASVCIGCGQCEGVCPHQLPIMEYLKECADVLEE